MNKTKAQHKVIGKLYKMGVKNVGEEKTKEGMRKAFNPWRKDPNDVRHLVKNTKKWEHKHYADEDKWRGNNQTN